LIAFALQGYLTQTHIHVSHPVAETGFKAGKAAGAKSAVNSATAQRSAPGDKAPSNGDTVKCPLCQAVGYAGHFVTPSAAASLLLPVAAISILPLTIADVSLRETPSHSWQSRGPPNS
jgi:hypothetical protein